jgi:hypothetical protein
VPGTRLLATQRTNPTPIFADMKTLKACIEIALSSFRFPDLSNASICTATIDNFHDSITPVACRVTTPVCHARI